MKPTLTKRQVIVVAACLGAVAACRSAEPTCATAVKSRAWTTAAGRCHASFDRNASSADGIGAAYSYLMLGRLDDAMQLARQLTTTDRSADAHYVLGESLARSGDPVGAVTQYELALAGHTALGEDGAVARDAYGMAGAWRGRGNLDRALAAQRLASTAAARSGDRAMTVYAEIGSSDLMRDIGDSAAAEQALTRALAAAENPADRAWALLKQGILYVSLARDAMARHPLEEALAIETRSPTARSELIVAAHLQLSWLDRRAGEIASALAHVDDAERLGAEAMDVHLNRGLALADGGRLAEAARSLDLAQAADPTGQWSWWVPFNRGLVAERMEDVEGAAAAYRRAIDAVQQLTAGAGARGAEVIANHRQPYLRLLGLHARATRWRDALGLIMALDAAAFIASDRSPQIRPTDLPSVAASESPAAPPIATTIDGVLDAWRGRHLVILVTDEVQMWRLEVRDGQVTGAAVGDLEVLEGHARRLEGDLAQDDAARALAEAIVPVDLGTAPLDVLLIGPISRTPLALLRRGDQLVIARTPLVRVLGVLPRVAPASRPGQGAVVLGDPRGDLPGARDEARAVAAVVDVDAKLGVDASSDALTGSRGAALLHLATHAELGPDGATLVLADRSVGAGEVAALAPAPDVVVLASCGGAAARDDAGWGSLAAAFLAAGADHVIASPWSVDDAVTLRVVAAFYRHGGARDPVRAIAATQVELADEVPATMWAGFVVFGAPPTLDR